MTKKPCKTAPLPDILLLIVVLAVAGGCEQSTSPAAAPGGVGHRFAVQAGAADATRRPAAPGMTSVEQTMDGNAMFAEQESHNCRSSIVGKPRENACVRRNRNL